MDVADIIDLARDQTHTNSTQFPDAQMLKYLNIVKNNFWSYIVSSISEDYDWDIFTTNTVVWQDEYVLPLMASDTAWSKKVTSVSVNYDNEVYDDGGLKYIKAKPVKLSSLKRNWNYYKNNQDKNFPIYYIADNSIFIAPTPTATTTAGIELKWIKKIVDYTIATLEWSMVIPVDHHEVLVQWMLPYIYKAKAQNAEAVSEKQEYIRQRTQSVRELADRNISPLYMDYPIDRESRSEVIYPNIV